jgi:hypothetical protein
MKRLLNTNSPAGIGAALLLLVAGPAIAQPVLTNPSFESGATPPAPGYSEIAGWTADESISTGYGINQAGGDFADNGAVPDGARVAFLQNNGSLSQRVSGFEVGRRYRIAYRENARRWCCGERVATLSVLVDGRPVIAPHVVKIVGDQNAYTLVRSDWFTAPHQTVTITFVKGGRGDSAVLIDDVQLVVEWR